MKQESHIFTIIKILSTVLPVFLIFTYDYGPNAKQIAYAGANCNAFDKKITDEKAMLRERAEQRMKAGEVVPVRVEDPGYPVANCVLPDNFPVNKGFVSFDTGFIGKIQYTCFNNELGKSIVARRIWYCEGSENREACILGKWIKGEPTFKSMLVGTHETGFGNITFLFKRCNIK